MTPDVIGEAPWALVSDWITQKIRAHDERETESKIKRKREEALRAQSQRLTSPAAFGRPTG